MRSLFANIYCLYLLKLSKWLMLIMPVVVLFYNDNGLDTYQIYLLQAGYSISVALFEIPSGYLADIVGRYSLDHAVVVFGIVLAAGSLAATTFMFRHQSFSDHNFKDDQGSGSGS